LVRNLDRWFTFDEISEWAKDKEVIYIVEQHNFGILEKTLSNIILKENVIIILETSPDIFIFGARTWPNLEENENLACFKGIRCYYRSLLGTVLDALSIGWDLPIEKLIPMCSFFRETWADVEVGVHDGEPLILSAISINRN
jgi:hypothetical protein